MASMERLLSNCSKGAAEDSMLQAGAGELRVRAREQIGGDRLPYQLPRAIGNLPSSQDFCCNKAQHNNPDSDRQHHCNDICEQERGYSISPSDRSVKGNLEMVHDGEEDKSKSRTPSRCPKCHS